MIPPELRDYQKTGFAGVRQSCTAGHRRICIVGPTGSGKMVMMTWAAIRTAQAAGRTIECVHTEELVLQHRTTLQACGARVGVISAAFPALADPAAFIQVASVYTLARRLHLLDGVDLLEIDEAHHAMAETWKSILTAAPDRCLVLGYTATPMRLDRKPLDDLFDDLVQLPQSQELIAQGWLVPPKVFAPPDKLDLGRVRTIAGDYAQGELEAAVDRANILGNAPVEYRKHANGLRALAFTITIKHAEQVAQSFRAAGYRAVALSGETDRAVRRQTMQDFRDGALDLISSCQILGEGLDVPGAGCIIQLRPTQSLTIFLQQCGRGSRPAPGKTSYVLLDLVGNTLRHGLPHEDRAWSLSAPPKGTGEAPVWRCEACDHVNPGGCSFCENCGAAHTRPPRTIIAAPSVQLVAENDPHALLLRRMKQLRWGDLHRQPRTLAELKAFAEARDYKPGWVYYATREQFAIFGRWPS